MTNEEQLQMENRIVSRINENINEVRNEVRSLKTEINELRDEYEGMRMGSQTVQRIGGSRPERIQALQPSSRSTHPNSFRLVGYRELIK